MTTWPRTRRAAALAAITASFACSRQPRRPDVLTIDPIAFAAPAGSALPNLSAFGDPAILSWVETVSAEASGEASRATLKFAERTANGWSEPRRLGDGVNTADQNENFPAVTADGCGLVFVRDFSSFHLVALKGSP